MQQFIDSEIYEYALETEKGTKSPEPIKTRSKKAIDKTYNLRSKEAKTERKTYDNLRTQRKPKCRNETQEVDRKHKIKVGTALTTGTNKFANNFNSKGRFRFIAVT